MKIVGHRGARGLAPENTVASLRKGVEHNVDLVEFDVRVTKDGVPVLHHDATIKLNGKKLVIANSNYEALRDLKDDLPTLEDALDAVNAKVPAYVEVKRNVDTEPVVMVLKKYIENIYGQGDLYIASKSQATLLALHKALPDVPTIVIEPWSGVRAGRRARQLNTKHIAMNQLWLWSGFIKAVSRSGNHLYAYTLNDPVKAKRWEKYGLYGVITDYPDRFQK